MRRCLPIVVLLPWLALACKVGPNYKPPRTNLSGEYVAPAAAATQPSRATTQPVQAAQWWLSLNDPQLNSLMAKASAANQDVRLAEARVRQARGMRTIAASALLPNLGVGASYTHMRNSKNEAPFNAFDPSLIPWEFDLYQTGFDASWELDVFGGARRNLEAAKADLQASVEAQRGVLVSVLAETARNYSDLRQYQQEHLIAQHNLQVQQQTLELAKDQALKGVGTELDVSRAAAKAYATEADLPRLRNLQRQAVYRLSVLTGQTDEKWADPLLADRPLPTLPAEVAVGIPADLLRRRPDIRQAERELAAATARVGAAVADLYPRFSLSGVFSLRSDQIGSLFEGNSRFFSFGPAVQWPIFQGGRLRATVKVRSAQQEEALARYEQTVLRAAAEVREALSTFVAEQDRARSLRSSVEHTRQATDLSGGLYRQGLTDFTTVLDAQRQLYLSEELLLQSQAVVLQSFISLNKALGGGWEAAGPSPASAPAAAEK